uniref:Uncharacterized protein n=1 Tax=Utricularia reniformis TaxID=192314 RepID=A0A1Y0B3I8_9LAMI|nr:hypothetical protein AEK19_MT1781 [Utricularia reniformis]ART31954.1 hypothetical protein AEK19_MT1781 [Utricularia reniformis]
MITRFSCRFYTLERPLSGYAEKGYYPDFSSSTDATEEATGTEAGVPGKREGSQYDL